MIRKIFLCDGDALAAPTDVLLRVAGGLQSLLPHLRRIGIYASVRNVLGKSVFELELLQRQKLSIAYLGLESGSDLILRQIAKGATSAEAREAGRRLQAAGWKQSVIIMLGIGGRALSSVHAQQTAQLLSEVRPEFLSFLTTIVVPGTPLARQVEAGQVTLLSLREILGEARTMVAGIDCGADRIIFRANHSSNLVPLEGILPRDRELLMRQLDTIIAGTTADVYPDLSVDVL